MKLEPTPPTTYAVKRYGDGGVVIGNHTYTTSILVMPQRLPAAWQVGKWEDIAADHLSTLLEWQPQLVIIGSGNKQQFLSPALLSMCWQQKIGCDIMTNAAACRTYNVLAQEGRLVLLALFFPKSS